MTENTLKLFKPRQAIVYNKDYEPISCIALDNSMYDVFTSAKLVNVPVHTTKGDVVLVPISAMPVYAQDGIRLIFTALDEDKALLLNNSFLPGMTKEINFIKNKVHNGIPKNN